MILAHDLGTTGDKASLHEADGRLVAAATVTYPTDFAKGGVAEQDPEQWWRAVCEATRTLLARTGTDPSRIQVVGLSGQMMGAVLLDAAHQPVRPALIWADHRSTAQAQRLVERLGMEAAYRVLGHRINPTYSLSKVMWVREHEPDLFRSVAHVCLAKDFVVHRLTGRLVTEPSDASSTNAFNQREGRWWDEALAAAEVDPGLMPEIVPSTTVVGEVGTAASGASGLRPGTPVVAGGGDGPLAAVGAGVTSPERGAYTYLGSSSWVSVASHQPLHDPSMRTMTFNHVAGAQYVPTATMQAGGASLQWIVDTLSGGAGDTGDPYDRLIGAATEVEAAAEGLFFLPHLLGERSPYWNPDAAGAFVGLARHHGPAHLTRAVLEGVAFNLSTCIDAFRECGVPVTRVDAIGGGAGSDVWLQILADVWGATVRRRTIVEEANSLGAAVTAGVGAGLLPGFDVAADLSTVTAEYSPDTQRHAALRQQHQLFLDAYGALEPWFPRRGGA